jgi:hypothetical protein
VHPKNINGQKVFSHHYPPTGEELMRSKKEIGKVLKEELNKGFNIERISNW